jgi:hypothetical protein
MKRVKKAAAEGPVKFCFDRLAPTPEISVEAMQAAIRENPANRFHGHFRMAMGVSPSNLGPALAIMTGKKWANGRRLKVRFLGGAESLQQKVAAFARQWSDYANITFDFGGHADAEIRISFQLGAGSWSAMGTDALVQNWFPPGQPTMNYGWLTPASSDDEIREVVLHEFGHALGCIHEHQHPQGGIPWNRDAVVRELSGPPNSWDLQTIESNVFSRYTTSQTQFSRFDTASIMGYYVPRRWTLNGFEMVPGSALSATDKDFITQVYPRDSRVTPLTVDGPALAASIGAAGEEDNYTFPVFSPGVYVVETLGATDVIASLFGPDGAANLIAEDDDSGEGRNARIVATLGAGNYRVMVRHYDRNGRGNYRIRVRRGQ